MIRRNNIEEKIRISYIKEKLNKVGERDRNLITTIYGLSAIGIATRAITSEPFYYIFSCLGIAGGLLHHNDMRKKIKKPF